MPDGRTTFRGVLTDDDGDEIRVAVEVLDLNEFLNAPPDADIFYTDAAGDQGWTEKRKVDWRSAGPEVD